MDRQLGPRGRELWNEITELYELSSHELSILIEACKTLDLIAELEDAIARDGTTTHTASGAVKVSPVVAEVRLQRIALSRLVASLRLPEEDAPSPQRRGGSRGVYQPRSLKAVR